MTLLEAAVGAVSIGAAAVVIVVVVVIGLGFVVMAAILRERRVTRP